MLSVAMIFGGLFIMCADSLLVSAIGIAIFAGAMYREGAFYRMKSKRKESYHRPK